MLEIKLIIFLISATIVTSKRFTQEKERYIIVLKDGSTKQDFESVINKIEIHEQSDWEKLEMKHISNLIPMLFATVSEQTIEKVNVA